MSLFNNIKKILLGNGAAQLIQFAFLPLSAFLYTPEQFGVFGTIQAYSTALTVFISLQLYVAIPFEKNQFLLNDLIVLNFKCIFAVTTFLLILYGLFNIDYFSILAIFLASITAVTNTLRSLIVYSGNFTRLSTSYVIRALVIVISQAALSFSTAINGLIYGLLLGEVIYSGLLHYFIKKSIDLPSFSLRSLFKVPIKNIFTKYRPYSLYGSILELTSVFIFYGPIVIFSYIFNGNNNYIGQYSFISRLVWPPIILISTSCTNALYFHITKINNLEVKSLTLKATALGGFIIAIAPFLGWCGHYIINLLIKTPTWNLVSDFGFYIITLAFVFMGTIYVRVVIRYKHLQKYQLIMDIFFIAIVAIILYFREKIGISDVFEILKSYTVIYFIYSLLLILGILSFLF
ncbi:translocase [Acinetobacter baumannii]|uniref:translocase n=1 Tax=Acinetobacter baumannii TaxID=470 RepID=UPI0020C89714|nr:translocase [Acinetobacter baumannii]